MSDTKYPILDHVNVPSDFRDISLAELRQLATDVREYLIEVVSQTGGHLGAGLGAVELTVALHYVFNTPYDKLVWDVGHQAYPHKIITGRRRRDLMTDYLASDPALVNTTDKHELRPLNWAVRADDKQTAGFLMSRGANPDAPVLTDAIVVGDVSMVKLLLAHGADPHANQRLGQVRLTMYQRAKALGRNEIAELLK